MQLPVIVKVNKYYTISTGSFVHQVKKYRCWGRVFATSHFTTTITILMKIEIVSIRRWILHCCSNHVVNLFNPTKIISEKESRHHEGGQKSGRVRYATSSERAVKPKGCVWGARHPCAMPGIDWRHTAKRWCGRISAAEYAPDFCTIQTKPWRNLGPKANTTNYATSPTSCKTFRATLKKRHIL